jgi:PepSY-associated transmembrane protein
MIPPRKLAIWTHRWMGVGCCLLFVMWFASGIVLMYCDYPLVHAEERLTRAATLDASRIQLSPEQAFAKLEAVETPDRVWIAMLDARPVYRFGFGDAQAFVYADNGEMPDSVSREMGLRIAAAWTRQAPGSARVSQPTEADQWTVYPGIWRGRPLWKYSWPNGEEVYVSQESGEVVQYTTRGSRIGAYFGAIPHWLYFTPLRSNNPAWRKAVIGLSGLGTLTTLFGLTVGVWMYSPSKPRSIPYQGQTRLHMILGLIFGLFAFTWVLSGMLSISPFDWDSDKTPEEPARALRAGQWSAAEFAAEHPREALAKVAGTLKVKELELARVLGATVYLAVEAPGRSRVIPMRGAPFTEFDTDQILLVMGEAGPAALGDAQRLDAHDRYYIDRHHRKPLPVLRVRFDDRDHSVYYVDLKTAQVVESYNARSRVNRWLYHGLHSIDLPWLYRNRPAWDLAVLTLMLGGGALSVTSVVIGWRRLRKKLRGRQTPRPPFADSPP